LLELLDIIKIQADTMKPYEFLQSGTNYIIYCYLDWRNGCNGVSGYNTNGSPLL